MEINNETRIINLKLKLFEEPGLNWLLFDLIDIVTEDAGLGVYSTKHREELITILRFKYLQEQAKYKRKNSKQQKLFKDENIQGKT